MHFTENVNCCCCYTWCLRTGSKFLCLLPNYNSFIAHRSEGAHRINSPRRPSLYSVNIFKRLILRSCWADFHQNSFVNSLGRLDGRLSKCVRSVGHECSIIQIWPLTFPWKFTSFCSIYSLIYSLTIAEQDLFDNQRQTILLSAW